MWKSVLQQIRDNPLFTTETPVLIDVTEVTTPLRALSEAMATGWLQVLPASRGAVVSAAGVAFEVCRDIEAMTGHRLRAFTNADAALAWLRS